jgi:hypothetical protein
VLFPRLSKFSFALSGIILVSFMSFSVVSCKDSKKSKSKKNNDECDPNDSACLERKRREAEAKNLQNQNVTSLSVTIDGQASGATIEMSSDDTAALALQVPAGMDPANLVVGLVKGPSLGLGIQGTTTVYTSSLPAGTHPITILVRDRAKCQSGSGSDCGVNPDEMGRFTTPVTLNPAYDTQFPFTLQVAGGTGTGGGTIQPPGQQSTGFFGTLWGNIKSGVQGSWIWNWLKGAFGGNQNP